MLNHHKNYEVGNISLCILEMTKLRHRENKIFSGSLLGGKHRNHDL